MTICGHRLLIAEDEPLLRITMADALRKEGWAVDVAEDGVKGVALFEQHLHDVVLTDLVMPRLGGMELLKRIKAEQPETTVVICAPSVSCASRTCGSRPSSSSASPSPTSSAGARRCRRCST
jgi:CheY-like chemotaxis protein